MSVVFTRLACVCPTRRSAASLSLIAGWSLVAVAVRAHDGPSLLNLDAYLMNAAIVPILLWRVVGERVAGPDLFGDRLEHRREVFRVRRKVLSPSQWDDARHVQQRHDSASSRPGQVRRKRDRIDRYLRVVCAAYQVLLIGRVQVVEAVGDHDDNAAERAVASETR